MQAHCLVEQGQTALFPVNQVVEETLELHRDLMPVAPDVDVLGAELARPHPDIAEHLLVKSFHPGESERRRTAGWPGREIPNDHLPDVLGLGPVELSLRGERFQPEPRWVDRRLAGALPRPFMPRSKACASGRQGARGLSSRPWTRLPRDPRPGLRARRFPGPAKRACVPSATPDHVSSSRQGYRH